MIFEFIFKVQLIFSFALENNLLNYNIQMNLIFAKTRSTKIKYTIELDFC